MSAAKLTAQAEALVAPAGDETRGVRASAEPRPSSAGRPDARTFALTPLQKALLAESMVALDNGANVEQIVWELDDVPDPERFRAAWQAAVDGFDALRLAFVWTEPGAEPRQAVLPPGTPVRFGRVDGPQGTPADSWERLERFLEEDRRLGFDLASPPLMRVSLLVLDACRAVCVWTIHHSVVDGNCYGTVLQHVLDAYAAGNGGGAPAKPHAQFTDVLQWFEGFDPGPGMRHFEELLRGFPAPTPLPLQEGEDRTAANRSSQTSLRLAPDVAEALCAVARESGATPNTLVQLAWGILLSRYAGDDDVVFGATWSGRVGALQDMADVVGPLINTLPVRVRLGEAATVRDAIVALRRQHLALRPFQQTPAGRIKAGSALAGAAHLFPTIVLFETARFCSTLRARDARWRTHRLWSRSQANVPLVLAAYFQDGALVLELEYDLGLYTEASAKRLLADYARVLTGLGKQLDTSPLHVPMLDPSLREQLTIAEVARELVPWEPSPIQRILERAAAAPDAPAVKALGGGGITYGQLERRVRRLSGVLQARGVKQGTLVGVLLSRSVEAVVSLLAVHAAGGAFVPLDPGDPDARLEFVVRNSGVGLVLVQRETRGRVRSVREKELDVSDPALGSASGAPRPPAFPDPTSPAYVIYTSGTTGLPKGVCVSHGALANHVAATTEKYGLGPADRALQFTSLNFDVCLEEIFPTLAAGAKLVLRNDAMLGSARRFFDAVREEGLTVLNLPTSFWHQLVRADEASWPACVRLLVVGSEQASPEALRRFRAAKTGHIRWLNGYGATETTITSTCYDDAEGDHGAEFVPIGRPLRGVSHFVLDAHRRLTPVGQSGQLYVGGAGLALGYLGREELTRQRFVEHPFRPGARLYATGDRVRRTGAGNHVYLGRLDNQVKVRGFRVELDGIEARLRQHPAVQDAAVVVRDRGGDASPVGFVMAERGSVTPAQLREHLAATLPSYMLPSRLVVVPELPKTSSGKIDRQALAKVDILDPATSEPTGSADDPLAQSLLDIWTRILGRPVTDPSASFFDLGGDSLLVVQLFTEIDARLGRTCDAPAFLRNPTISNLAALLRSPTRADWSAPLMELRRGDPAVRPLFLAPTLLGRGLSYVHLAEAMSGNVPVYALQAPPASHGPQEKLQDFARYFADQIQARQPAGPYAIGGFSAAGIVAVAIAEELRARGERTELVAAFDSVPPGTVPVPSPFRSPSRFARFLRTVVGRVWEILTGPAPFSRLWSRTRAAVLRGLARWEVLQRRHEPQIADSVEAAVAALPEAERARMRRYLEAIWSHAFGHLQLDLVLFRVALDPFEGPHEPDLGWRRVTGGTIKIEHLPGLHESVLMPQGARELASRLAVYLDRRAPASR